MSAQGRTRSQLRSCPMSPFLKAGIYFIVPTSSLGRMPPSAKPKDRLGSAFRGFRSKTALGTSGPLRFKH
jgi:hypothetical protein